MTEDDITKKEGVVGVHEDGWDPRYVDGHLCL